MKFSHQRFFLVHDGRLHISKNDPNKPLGLDGRYVRREKFLDDFSFGGLLNELLATLSIFSHPQAFFSSVTSDLSAIENFRWLSRVGMRRERTW